MTDNELIKAINEKLSTGEFPMAKQAGFWEATVWSVLNIQHFQDPKKLREHLLSRLNDE